MKEETTFKGSEDQFEKLQHEDFIAEVLKRRAPTATVSKSGFQKFLESTGGAAIITVLGTGIVGGFLTSEYQRRAKDRDAAAASNQKFAEKREETAKAVLDVIAERRAAGEDLVRFKQAPGTDTSKYTSPNLAAVVKEIENAGDAKEAKWNEVENKWNSKRASLDLLLRYYYSDTKEFRDAWKEMQGALDNYSTFSVDCFRFNNCEKADQQKAGLDTVTSLFIVALTIAEK